ncbi:cytochrome b/b6 domain-containing protein [Myxococcota bacterium]|nr:cytochrome b/b6 domain-containing protein [Myxococcota bacterium]MBU1432631.1 cytochrome b/b6 domain-containing protein [Myxococcota bacterium]MBU1899506.1 cytochrome b/b6 domain-containing protein [Myxococcota bacterium]
MTTRKLFLYSAQERFWHWVQAALIFGLLFTGAVIRYPSALSFFNFEISIYVHNVLAFLLFAHALLALFYFFTSGQIKQYKIERSGLVNGLVKQVIYYSYGIFKGAVHPFHPSEEKRLNLLQRMSYLFLLNVLLPLQVISGVLIFFAAELSAWITPIGGLPVLLEVHAGAAWIFFTFIIMHMYLTTTGDTVMQHVMTMVVGYEVIEEKHQHKKEEA